MNIKIKASDDANNNLIQEQIHSLTTVVTILVIFGIICLIFMLIVELLIIISQYKNHNDDETVYINMMDPLDVKLKYQFLSIESDSNYDKSINEYYKIDLNQALIPPELINYAEKHHNMTKNELIKYYKLAYKQLQLSNKDYEDMMKKFNRSKDKLNTIKEIESSEKIISILEEQGTNKRSIFYNEVERIKKNNKYK